MLDRSVSRIAQVLLDKEPLSIFFGAGVSREAGAPLWSEFVHALLASLASRAGGQEIVRRRTDLMLREELAVLEQELRHRGAGPAPIIKNELALHWVHTVLGDRLLPAFRVFGHGSHSQNHLALAVLGTLPDVCLATSNFDNYLEDAFHTIGIRPVVFASQRPRRAIASFRAFCAEAQGPWPHAVRLLKAHGTLQSLETIQATLAQVSRPVSASLAACFRLILEDRHVLVMGYSGYDFDLFPLILEHGSHARSFTWVNRSGGEAVDQLKASVPGLHLVCGDLGAFLRALRKTLGGHLSPLNVAGAGSRELPGGSLTRPDVPRVTRALLDGWASAVNAREAAYALALLFAMSGKEDLSESLCRDVLSRRDECDDLTIVRTLDLLGNTNKRRNPSASRKYFALAERACRPIRGDHPALYARVLGNIGALFYETCNYKRSISYLRKSDYWARKAGDEFLLAQNSNDLGIVYRSQGAPAKALSRYRTALRTVRRLGELRQVARTLANIGTALADLGDLQGAEKALLQSIDLKRKESADLATIAGTLVSLAEVRMRRGRYDEALGPLKEALVLARGAGDRVARVRALYDMASALRATHVPASVRCFERAEKGARSIGHWRRDPTRMKWVEGIRQSFRRAAR